MSGKHCQIKWTRVVYLILLFGIWGGLSGTLLYEKYLRSDSDVRYVSLETGIRDIPTEAEWMAIYHQERHLGYAVFNVMNRDSLGYVLKSTTQMNIALAGVETNIHMESTVHVDPLFKLDSFFFRLISDQYSTKIKGLKDGTNMNLTFYQGNDSTLQTMQVPEELYTYTGIQPMVASQGIKPGETIRMPAFDPASLEMSDVRVHHAGKERREINGQEYELNRLELEFQGIPSILWLDDNGLTYREETVMGLVMERSTPAEAMQFTKSDEIDLLDLYAVRPQPPLERVAQLTALTLELEGVEPALFQMLDSPRQQVVQTDPLILRLRKMDLPRLEDDLSPYLAATEIIQCEHPGIQEAASRIVANIGPLAQKTRALTFWVFEHLAKRPVVSLSSASEILEAGIGDCTEHTTLFTALARAAGIPTRVHVGLVHVQGRFLYHAWPEVFVNDHWVAVDPTLGQYPADPTHITLLVGDFANLTQLVPILGNLRIKVLEQQYGDRHP